MPTTYDIFGDTIGAEDGLAFTVGLVARGREMAKSMAP